MIGEMILEYTFGKVSDVSVDVFKQWFKEKKGQKILLKCFEEYIEREGTLNCILDKIKPVFELLAKMYK